MQAGNWQRWRKIHTTARECPRFEHGVTTIFYLFMAAAAAAATSGSASRQEAQAAEGVVPHAAYPQLHLAMLVAAAAAAAVPWQRRRELATLTTAAEGADEQ